MLENSIYFGKSSYYNIIRSIGGQWNDSKERPIVCLMKLSENDNIYWAIPIGNWDHRDNAAKARIQKFCLMTKKIYVLAFIILERPM